MAGVRVVIAELNEFIDKTVIRIVLDVVAALSAAPSEGGTPIDTGWASANWIPYIGTAPSAPAGERPTAEGLASRSKQQSQVAKMVGYSTDKGDVIIANNVPYITLLNDAPAGSKQAPAGFIQAAIAKAITQ